MHNLTYAQKELVATLKHRLIFFYKFQQCQSCSKVQRISYELWLVIFKKAYIMIPFHFVNPGIGSNFTIHVDIISFWYCLWINAASETQTYFRRIWNSDEMFKATCNTNLLIQQTRRRGSKHSWLLVAGPLNRGFRSVVFDSSYKMALRTFYFINVYRDCRHFTTWSTISAIFLPLLKTTDRRNPLFAINLKIWSIDQKLSKGFNIISISIAF